MRKKAGVGKRQDEVLRYPCRRCGVMVTPNVDAVLMVSSKGMWSCVPCYEWSSKQRSLFDEANSGEQARECAEVQEARQPH